MTIAELRAMIEGLPDDMAVKMNYEMYANSSIDTDVSGVSDDVFWVVAYE